jgi:hypothetical protein
MHFITLRPKKATLAQVRQILLPWAIRLACKVVSEYVAA